MVSSSLRLPAWNILVKKDIFQRCHLNQGNYGCPCKKGGLLQGFRAFYKGFKILYKKFLGIILLVLLVLRFEVWQDPIFAYKLHRMADRQGIQVK